MPEFVELLEPQTQAELRRELAIEHPLQNELRDEAVAALAYLGQLPEPAREAGLAILPLGLRHELLARGLVATRPRNETNAGLPLWTFTDEGNTTATQLAATLPKESADQVREREHELASLLAEAKRELGEW